MSCIIAEKHLDDAARAIHAEFFGQVVTFESEEQGPRPTRPVRKTAKKPGRRVTRA